MDRWCIENCMKMSHFDVGDDDLCLNFIEPIGLPQISLISIAHISKGSTSFISSSMDVYSVVKSARKSLLLILKAMLQDCNYCIKKCTSVFHTIPSFHL